MRSFTMGARRDAHCYAASPQRACRVAKRLLAVAAVGLPDEGRGRALADQV
jgi:hypothetical protein